MSKVYEGRERAVLHEYYVILQKLVDRAAQKQKDAQQQQQQAPRLTRENSASSSRPPSAPAGLADAPQQMSNGQGALPLMPIDPIECNLVM